MQLNYKEIPAPFLQSLPEGIRKVMKHDETFLVVERLFCPNGHNLVVNTVRIHDEPSVKLIVKVGDSEGAVFVDAFWGGHAKLYSFIPDIKTAGPVVAAFCPECHVDLTVEDKCTEKDCDAGRAIMFRLPGNENMIYDCAKLGCPGHRIDVVDMPDLVTDQVSHINYFGAEIDDILLEL